jgi:predicted membrane protein
MTLTINSLTCRLLTASYNFAGNLIYVALSLVALNLLQILKTSTGNWGMFILMSFGLLISISSTIIWSLLMKIYSNKFCWIGDVENRFHWINNAIRFLIVLASCFFIFRCLSLKRGENGVRLDKKNLIYIFQL